MNDDEEASHGIKKPEISRFAFAMFDVLGFSNWIAETPLQEILDAYHVLIEDVVVKPNSKGGVGAIQMPEGAVLTVTGPPGYAYFSDTILIWYPLVPAFVDSFVSSCNDLVCQALSMDIPLRGAIALGDAVLDPDAGMFLGTPIVEAANLEKGQNWVGTTLGKSAIWSPFLAQMHGTSIIEYAPPMKERYREFASPIVLDWPRRWRDTNEIPLAEKLQSLNKKPEKSLYWDNTIAFAEYSERKHDWHLRPDEIPSDAILRLVSRGDADYG